MDSEDSESNTAPPIFQEIPEFLQPVDAGLNDIMDDLVIKDIPEFLPAMDSEDSESNAAPPIFQEIPEFLQLVDAGLNDIMDDVVFDVPALSPAMNCEDPESNTAAPYFRDIPAFSQSVAAGLNGDVAFEELILPVVEEIPEFLQSVAAGSNNVSDVQPSKTAWVASSHEDPSSDVHPFMPTISEALDAHRSLGRISSSLTYPEEALILASYAGLEAKRQQIYLREVRVITERASVLEHKIQATLVSETHASRDQAQCDLSASSGPTFFGKAPEVTWLSGRIRTKLPWLPDPSDPLKNLLWKDEAHLRYLADSARSSAACNWIKRLDYNDYSDDLALAHDIREALSQNMPVHLINHKYKPVSLTSVSLHRDLYFEQKIPVVAQDCKHRVVNHVEPFAHMTLNDFCDGVRDNTRIQAVLDLPSVDSQIPAFLNLLDDGHTAWSKIRSMFPDRVNFPIDFQNSRSWVLLHHAGFHSYAHHDAAGYSSWVQVLDGDKLWVFLRPLSLMSCKTRQDYQEAMSPYLETDCGPEGFYGSESERIVIHASAGDIIVQPPGMPHEVYTPTPTVAIGGHLYTYGSMHLTEISRALDVDTAGHHSNQVHASAPLTLSMMMCALPTYSACGESHVHFPFYCLPILESSSPPKIIDRSM
ncbi:hypothetical protein BDZ97DRAFT_1928679 [Flammula alnicola]|nr:hypothetical protein BDZ97DRAFT_1928679 [Flammula alnicola]